MEYFSENHAITWNSIWSTIFPVHYSCEVNGGRVLSISFRSNHHYTFWEGFLCLTNRDVLQVFWYLEQIFEHVFNNRRWGDSLCVWVCACVSVCMCMSRYLCMCEHVCDNMSLSGHHMIAVNECYLLKIFHKGKCLTIRKFYIACKHMRVGYSKDIGHRKLVLIECIWPMQA